MSDTFTELLPPLKQLLYHAATAILDIYDHPDQWDTRLKADDSPVTRADRLANDLLAEGLYRLRPDVVLLAEESTLPSYEKRCNRYCWVLDPLDGTREFLGRTGEFVINLALCDPTGKPVLAMIAQPTTGQVVVATKGGGSTLYTDWSADGRPMRAAAFDPAQTGTRVLVSRSHAQPRLETFLRQLDQPRTMTCGSALKLCRLADGQAEWYPRLEQLCDWDIAAGHLILTEAGGHIRRLNDGKSPTYNGPTVVQAPFLAWGQAPPPSFFYTLQ